jgi:hypothetical protein
MCLEVTVTLPRGEKSKLGGEEVAKASGLSVRKYRTDDGKEAFHLSSGGGCSCDLLPDKFSWRSPTWRLIPERLPSLASAVSTIGARSRSFSFTAKWLGPDRPDPDSKELNLKSLIALIRQNQVGNSVEYVVGAA